NTGALYGQQLGSVVVVDFPIRPPEVQREHDSHRPRIKPKEIYPTLDAALRRFKLIPPQPCANHFILEHIARHSLVAVKGGWHWKFDDGLFDAFELGNIPEMVDALLCPLAVLYGEKSALFTPEIIAFMGELLGEKSPLIKMPGLHHHLFLEDPLEFIKVLRGLLQSKAFRSFRANEGTA